MAPYDDLKRELAFVCTNKLPSKIDTGGQTAKIVSQREAFHFAYWSNCNKLKPDLSTEAVQQGAGVDVPQADGEVDRSGNEVSDVVPRMLVVRVQKAVDATRVAQQKL